MVTLAKLGKAGKSWSKAAACWRLERVEFHKANKASKAGKGWVKAGVNASKRQRPVGVLNLSSFMSTPAAAEPPSVVAVAAASVCALLCQ